MAGRELKVEIVGDASSLQKALGSATKTSDKFGSSLAKMGKLAVVGIAAVGGAAVIAGKKMVDMASDAAEVDSKLDVVFGKTLPKLTKNLDAFSEATGASRYELRQQAADMGALLAPLTGTTAEAAKMSEQFVKLATDLGSFNNVPVGDALLAIRSGLVGEAEPLRRFGVLLNEAAVKAEAYRSGIAKAGSELTEQQKVQARANLIMQQTTLAQGDAIRTSDSAANQFKRLRNSISDLATDMGMALLPAVTRVVQGINDNFPMIEKVITSVMSAVTAAVSAAVAEVRTHWNTIKAVAKTAFDGVVSAGRTFVNFMRTDLGQTLGQQGLIFIGLAVAIGKIVPAVQGAMKALTAIKTNPLWAALIPLGVAIGVLADHFIDSKLEAIRLGDAMRKTAGDVNVLKASLDLLEGATIGVERATINELRTRREQAAAQREVVEAMQKYGANAPQTVAAQERLTETTLNHRDAVVQLHQAQDLQTEQQRDRNQLFRDGVQGIIDTSTEVGKMSAINAGAAVTSKEFAVTQDAASREAAKFAAKMRESSADLVANAAALKKRDPALAQAKFNTAALADALGHLAMDMERVPTKREINVLARLLGKGKTIEEAKAMMREMGLLDGKAEGKPVGASYGEGVASGISSMIDVVRAAAASLITEADSAARAAAGKPQSPAPISIPLGESYAEGVTFGIAKKLAEETPNTKDNFKKFIGEATDIVNDIKAKGFDLGDKNIQGIIDGIIGKTPTLKQQLMTALREAANEAAEAAAQAIRDSTQKVADAFGTMASAALAAFDAVTAAWQNPITKKLDAELAARQMRDLKEAITETDDALKAAQASAVTAGAEVERLAVISQQISGGTAIADIEGLTEEEKKKLQGMTPEEAAAYIDEREEAARDAQKKANDAIIAAQKAHEDALFNLHVEQERRRAAKLDEDRAKERAKKRAHLQDEIEDIENSWAARKGKAAVVHKRMIDLLEKYGIDYRKVGRLYGKELSDGIVDAVDELRAALDELAKNLKGKSPPVAGPLRQIDKWGYKVGRAWMDSFTGAFKPTRADQTSWADLLAGIDKSIGSQTEFSFGAPEPPGSPFASVGIPGGLNPSLYQFAAQLAADAGKFDEFVEDMMKGRTNARLLDLLYQNRSRWNWSKYPSWIANIMNTMRDLMLSGAEAAPLFGLKKGGIVTQDGWRYMHAPEAAIPLNDSRADRYLGGSSRGGVTVVLQGGTYIGGDPDAIARDMAPALNTALGKLYKSGTSLAFQG